MHRAQHIVFMTFFLLSVSPAAADSFGNPSSDPVPNLTKIEVYDVSDMSQQQRRTGGELQTTGFDKLNLVVDEYALYRFDLNISNDGTEIWNISAEDTLEYTGLDSSWDFKEAFYTISQSRDGGNFTSGEIKWNTSKGGKLYPDGENSTMRASFVINISTGIPQQTNTAFLANDTSNNSGSQYSALLTINETGYLNLSFVRPPDNTVLQRNNTFTLTGQAECLNGVCGKTALSPRYNTTGPDADTVITAVDSTPFYTESTNLKICSQYLGREESCRNNFTVNATGSIGSDYSLDVNASSNISGVANNDSDDSGVEIKSTVILDLSWETVSFGPVDPGRRNVSAEGNSGLQYNITVPDESREVDNLYINASPLVSQVNSDYEIPVENITHSFSNNVESGTQLSRTFNNIKTGISPGTVLNNFFFLDVPYGLTTGEYRGAITFRANSTFEG